MAIDAKSMTPAQRAHFLDYLQTLGGQPAVTAGLEVLAKVDRGQPWAVVPPIQSGITLQIPPQLLANLPSGTLDLGIPAGDVWK